MEIPSEIHGVSAKAVRPAEADKEDNIYEIAFCQSSVENAIRDLRCSRFLSQYIPGGLWADWKKRRWKKYNPEIDSQYGAS